MTFRLLCSTLCLALLAGLAFAPPSADAQVWKRVKKAAKETVERKAEEKTENAVEATIDGMTNAVLCAVTDRACIERAQSEGKTVVMTDADGEVIRDESGEPVTDPAAAQAQAAGDPAPLKPGEGVWANYDFVPGSRILFFEDFDASRTGDFPHRMEFIGGNMEVVEWNGQKLLRANAEESRLAIQLPERLPERFTIEFDLHDANTSGMSVATAAPDNFGWAWTHQYKYSYFTAGSSKGAGVVTFENYGPTSTLADKTIQSQIRPVRIAVDGSYVKMYVGEKRVANVPNATIERTDKVYFFLEPYASRQVYTYVDNVRIAAGGMDLYEKLEAEGRVTTQGVYFDTGSARLRPESTPTLKEIARMLDQHADLRLRIEGHTDDTGTPEGNQALSQQRSESVRTFLMAEYGVPADRLEAVGMGQTVPAAPNDTEEGRQTNRRVELVRL
jgi:outer membrane protein OmpA-like peptidoglycan-associated protein